MALLAMFVSSAYVMKKQCDAVPQCSVLGPLFLLVYISDIMVGSKFSDNICAIQYGITQIRLQVT